MRQMLPADPNVTVAVTVISWLGHVKAREEVNQKDFVRQGIYTRLAQLFHTVTGR